MPRYTRARTNVDVKSQPRIIYDRHSPSLGRLLPLLIWPHPSGAMRMFLPNQLPRVSDNADKVMTAFKAVGVLHVHCFLRLRRKVLC